MAMEKELRFNWFRGVLLYGVSGVEVLHDRKSKDDVAQVGKVICYALEILILLKFYL